MTTTRDGSVQAQNVGLVVLERGPNKDSIERTIEFTAKMPTRWRWQDADEIVSISESDKKHILSLIHSLSVAYKSGSADKARRLASAWSDGPRPWLYYEGSTQFAPKYSLENDLVARSDVDVQIVNDDGLEFNTGNRLVRVRAKGLDHAADGVLQNRPIIVITIAGEAAGMTMRIRDLYFSRKNGKWALFFESWIYHYPEE